MVTLPTLASTDGLPMMPAPCWIDSSRSSNFTEYAASEPSKPAPRKRQPSSNVVEVSGSSVSRMAAKPAAVVLNGPAVPALTNARAFCANWPNTSWASDRDQLKPACGRKPSSMSMVPVLLSPVIVRAVFSTFRALKPKFSRSASLTRQVSCRCNCRVSVSNAYSHCVSSGLRRNSVKSCVGTATFGSG